MSADLPPLFELAEQTSQRPKRRTETQVAFYDRIDDEAIGRVRAVIEAWFEGYAANDSKEAFKLRQRLRSGRDDDFMAAVWELYLHETFVRLGFGVTVEPAVDGGEIDFYIERASTRLYVEATTLLRPAVSGAELAPGYAPALDAVDDAFHPDFGLMVRGFVPGRGNPPLKKLTAAAERLMSQFDWEDLRGSRSIDMTERVLEVDGWTLHVVVWPRPAADRGCRDYATVLMEPSLGGVSHAREAILRKLRAKAQKYKNLDAPFVIAINSFAMVGDEEDILQALYGSEVYTFNTEHPDAGELGRKPDGLWQRGAQIAFTRVSAVLAASQLNLHVVGKAWPRLWTNPWAADPLEADAFPWPRGIGDLERNQIERIDSTVDPGGFFGLPADWPGEAFAPKHRRRAERREVGQQR